jgi:uncharacterized protein
VTKPLRIVELSREEGLRLLAAQRVGRIAFSFHDRVDIEPIAYVYDDGWIYARTSPGTKLTTVRHHPYVAFEIDDIRGAGDWRSVVVHGTIYFLDPEPDREPDPARGIAGGTADRQAHAHALRVLRTLDPAALTAGDATPYRHQLFRIHVDQLTAREARRG